MPAAHAFLDGPHPRAFVHRGWHTGELTGMENSLAAFRRAALEGFSYLETDVHATSDGVAVVHHDAVLDRTTDAAGVIGQLPWPTVRQAKIGGREPVCRLTDLLEELPEARLNIDVKAEQAVEPLLEALRRTNSLHRVCVASFSESRLVRVRKLAGDGLLTSMGISAVARLWASGRLPLGILRPGRQRIAQVPLRQGRLTVLDARLLACARKHGIEVHVWTIDDAEGMNRLLDLGVDGIMTDRPDVLKGVFAGRGVWASPA